MFRSRPLRERVLRRLDWELRRWDLAPGAVPGDSWLRTTRIALGMSTRQLAKRVGVSEPAVRRAEKAEADGSISLATLRRYAVALECDVAYVLKPRGPSLRTILEDRAEALYRAKDPHRQMEPHEIRLARHWILSRNLSPLW